MKGAMAEPLAKTIRAPKKSRTRMMGSSQYFFRTFRKPHKSFKKSGASITVCSLKAVIIPTIPDIENKQDNIIINIKPIVV
jgi:hypothetical protein